MKLGELKVNAKAVEDGAWVENIPDLGGVRLKVRGSNNRDWRRLQQRLIEAVPRKKRVGGRIDPEEQDKITTALLVGAGLLDWEGLEGDDGQPLAYSRKAAQELLENPELMRLRDGVLWACTMVAEQDAASAEETAKN